MSRMPNTFWMLGTTSALAILFTAQPLLAQIPAAQQSQQTGVESEPATGEIVVTATRRADSIQNVPLSISAMSASSLQQRSANSFFDYGSAVPNLSFGNTGEGTTGSRAIAIRGIADRNTTGFYIDETPVSESLDPKIVDVERIEVLRGPQGTLFGARSLGGTVRVITTQPDTNNFTGRVHASISSTAHTSAANYMLDGAVNIPIVSDMVGLRLVGVREQQAGYFDKVVGPLGGVTTEQRNIGRQRTNGFSAALLVKPTDGLTIKPRLLYQKTKVAGFPFADVAVQNNGQPQDLTVRSLDQRRLFDVAEYSNDRWLLGTLDINYRSDIGTLTLSTSYFDRKTFDMEDDTDFISSPSGFGITPQPASISLRNTNKNFTQEARFASDLAGPFNFVAGAFFTNNRSHRIFPPSVVPGLDAQFGGFFGTDLIFQSDLYVKQKDEAVYAEGTFEVSEHLKAIAGARLFRVTTTSSQVADGIVAGGPSVIPLQTTRDSGVQPKFSLQYRFSPQAQIYATAAKGFRPGGVNGVIPTALGCAQNLSALGLTPQDAAFYKADTVWSYEAGAKTSMLDRALTVNASGFLIDWDAIQQRIQLQCGFGFRGNAGQARSKGVELEVNARPMSGLDLGLGFGYVDAKFRTSAPGTNFVAGDRVPQVPRYTLTLSANYAFEVSSDLKAVLHADYRYVGNSISVLNATKDANGRLIPRVRPSYQIVDTRAGLSSGPHEVAVFVKNLTNERAVLGDALSLAAETPGRARVTINQPRTAGIEYRLSF